MTRPPDTRPTLLLVDDEPTNLQVLRHALQDDYRLLFAKHAERALLLARTEHPDLILLDIMLPEISGYAVCQSLKADQATAEIPVIFLTALADAANEQTGLDLGAADYITKPIHPGIVRTRVRNHLSLVQMQALRASRLQIVQCLGMAAEYKDNETGQHVIRMSHYARTLARAVGFSAEAADDLLHAAPMHDVGKIGIPDAILQKPGKLTPEEWRIMQQHTVIGARILGEHRAGLLAIAGQIAQSHHEKWDGSGYPDGLCGEAIPLVARIVALADVFDALTSERPYKRAWSVQEALDYVRTSSGSHFDPALVVAFEQCLPEILAIQADWRDVPVAEHLATSAFTATAASA